MVPGCEVCKPKFEPGGLGLLIGEIVAYVMQRWYSARRDAHHDGIKLSACPLKQGLRIAHSQRRTRDSVHLHQRCRMHHHESSLTATYWKRSPYHAKPRLRAVSPASSVEQSTTRKILAGLEGNQEELLRVSEAFWKVTQTPLLCSQDWPSSRHLKNL